MDRASGILLPISALPSPYGIGTLGKAAYAFADFLHAAGQKYWQLLPLGPTSYGDSPYQSFSTFAGNPYFIDLDLLAEEGLLDKEDLAAADWAISGGEPVAEKLRPLHGREGSFRHEELAGVARRGHPGPGSGGGGPV